MTRKQQVIQRTQQGDRVNLNKLPEEVKLTREEIAELFDELLRVSEDKASKAELQRLERIVSGANKQEVTKNDLLSLLKTVRQQQTTANRELSLLKNHISKYVTQRDITARLAALERKLSSRIDAVKQQIPATFSIQSDLNKLTQLLTNHTHDALERRLASKSCVDELMRRINFIDQRYYTKECVNDLICTLADSVDNLT